MASISVPLPRRLGSAWFLAAVVAAPLLLAFSRLLPAEGAGLAVRLAAAAACVLVLPGALVLRAVGWPSSPGVAAGASVGLSLTVVFVALALTFAARASLAFTIAVLAAVAVAALVPALRGRSVELDRSDWIAAAGVVGASVLFAGAVWWAAEPVHGDGFFHLARARKLAELDSLSVLAVNEFADGGLHPGYGFPLWHGVVALVARLGGVDPAAVLVHLASVLVPLAFLVTYGAGAALFRSWVGGVAALAGQVAQLGFPRGGTGVFDFLASPPAAGRLLLVPAVLALAFTFMSGGGTAVLVALAAAAFALAVVHPTHAIFVAIPLAGFLAARVVLATRDWGGAARIGASLAAVLVPSGLFFVWLLPAVTSTASHTPGAGEEARGIEHYAGQVDVVGDAFRLAPEATTRGGPGLVAGLVAIPLAVFAVRRAWAAFVLGGSLLVLAVLLVPTLFSAFSDLVSLSQSRRLGGFLPIPFALAGAAVVVGRLKLAGVAAGLGAGLAAQIAYPGEFTYRLQEGGPTWPVWFATVGGAVALVAGALLARKGRRLDVHPTAWGAAVAIAFVVPLAVAGVPKLESEERTDPYALTPGLVAELRKLEPRDVVFSDVATSYRVAAYAPVYIAAAPPGHVANTERDRPYERRRDVNRFLFGRVGDAERRRILSEYGADWLLVDKTHGYPKRFTSSLTPAYEDERFALFRVERR